ncbi:integral membrane sensor signal transduction histidine kinase [Halothece sp. PCC 7418]|uniref:sensor histidine kinase n=1 Tax=Halothece sp. (strain PCC 7418) TaxID=65093 RepID=UPI0002A06615|nr:sensor histidine kinase [Halothece sp. PCC 7418]AFZ43150.1 integral membrane sensor signal transduction histidine kinase [Halothece sp. PCC 7418]
MNHLITIKTHPFRFLLYLEWILFGISLIGEILIPPPLLAVQVQQFKGLIFLVLVILCGLGLKLPKRNSNYKLLYILFNLFLAILVVFLGGSGRTLPFLYLIVLIRACLIYPPQKQVLITVLTVLSFLFTLSYRLRQIEVRPEVRQQIQLLLPSFILLFCLSLLFVLILINTLLAERESRSQLAIAHKKLRQYALKIEDQATLQERNRIAREIHDSLGHILTALNLQLEGGLKLWETQPQKAYSFIQKAKELGSQGLQEVRQSVSSLRRDPLGGKSLAEAIQFSLQELEKTTGIYTNCDLKNCTFLSTEISRVVYRLVQEALTNITKHACASQIWVSLEIERTEAILMISDDGKGFEYTQNTTGFGLQGMKERTLSLGGQFKITSELGKGCTIEIIFPVEDERV